MLKRIDAAGILFQDVDGFILLLLRHPNGDEGGTWGLVGGKLDEGESSVEAAVRETKEEIGLSLDAQNLKLTRSYNWSRAKYEVSFDVYLYLVDTRPANVQLDLEENIEYGWFSPKEAYARKDLMEGLYPILKDHYGL